MPFLISIFVSFLMFSSSHAAPFLHWGASPGAGGYNVYCGAVPAVSVPAVDAGNVLTYDLAGTVVAGTEYECWVTAYAVGLPESPESNHIQFTPALVSQTFVVPGQPSQVLITWQ